MAGSSTGFGPLTGFKNRSSSSAGSPQPSRQPKTEQIETPPLDQGRWRLCPESAISSISDASLAKLAVPYQEASFQVPNQQEPDSLSTGSVEEIIKEIIRLEGPIHVDELTNRVKTLWVIPGPVRGSRAQ